MLFLGLSDEASVSLSELHGQDDEANAPTSLCQVKEIDPQCVLSKPNQRSRILELIRNYDGGVRGAYERLEKDPNAMIGRYRFF